MVHDRELLDRLSAYASFRFDDTAFRATRLGLDALTPSLAGGRWAPRDITPVLYTSFEREGEFGSLGYRRTQEIGAAVAFLECDGLIAPSARWPCENLMLFTGNQAAGDRRPAIGSS